MRVKSSYLFVAAVGLLLVLFFGLRSLFGGEPTAQANTSQKAAVQEPTVQAVLTPETLREQPLVVRGRTEAARTVSVKAETAGVVAAVPAVEGALVRKGQVLCRLNIDARQASLDQARAALRSRQLTQKASADLAAKGYRSQTQVLQDQANLDAAAAAVRQAEIAIEQTNIRAPFTGVFDRRDAEVGTYLSPGQACGTMIELDPLLVVGDVPETDAHKLRVGAPATATLLSGGALNGRVRYVAREADPQTRTYHFEIQVPNPQLTARSGLSAEVRVSSGVAPSHLAPLSSLVLDAGGRQGVRYVLADNRVAFAPVKVLEETPQGVWVSGLSGPVRIITVGQSYVADGQKVRVASAR